MLKSEDSWGELEIYTYKNTFLAFLRLKISRKRRFPLCSSPFESRNLFWGFFNSLSENQKWEMIKYGVLPEIYYTKKLLTSKWSYGKNSKKKIKKILAKFNKVPITNQVQCLLLLIVKTLITVVQSTWIRNLSIHDFI